MTGPRLAIHGGAGGFAREPEGSREDAALRRALAECLARGQAALERGAAALDVVERAVATLEDDPRFNAGHGSALTRDGRVEMDASIMDGRTRAAGAVACVTRLANPIVAARLVMERSEHVLLVGPAADGFALAQGAREVDPESLVTERQRRELARVRAGGASATRAAGADGAAGTVGAVARDGRGHLAAATSTGGLAGKLPGRVGDSGAIGAGTWADDATCAVSGTGHGEAFLRCALAHEVDALVRHLAIPLDAACAAALARVEALGSSGGLIALGRDGDPVLRFQTPGMARAWVDARGRQRVAIRADE